MRSADGRDGNAILSLVCVTTALSTGLAVRTAAAGDDHAPLSVTVSFGAGLNTATPNNPPNHHVLPKVIRVGTGGVVNFVVAGFHQIFVYVPGVKVEDIQVPASGTFINDLANLYYSGILPAGGPPPAIPATVHPSNAQNRVESVSFSQPGTYLVICNVRGHFLDGMVAYVKVGGDEDDDHHKGHGEQ
jgi:plastocyanin